jgi:[ribosomal protein S18]-alanine N-acetyltransferase
VEFTLRDFRPEDFETLWSIDQKCFAPGIAYSRRELSIYIRRKGSFTVVAENPLPPAKGSAGNSQIFGFIVAEANRRRMGHIISIDVLPDARRSGLGSKLLGAAEERLRSDGCRVVLLETAVDNLSALSFYKRHSYCVIKALPRYYSNGTDALVLEKELLTQAKDGTSG